MIRSAHPDCDSLGHVTRAQILALSFSPYFLLSALNGLHFTFLTLIPFYFRAVTNLTGFTKLKNLVMDNNEIGDEKVELDRLNMALKDNILTPWVKANGFGDVDMARLAKSIDQIGDTYEYKSKPKAADIFTSEFLPPAADRRL